MMVVSVTGDDCSNFEVPGVFTLSTN